VRTLVVNALRLAGAPTAMARYIEALAETWSAAEVPFDRVLLAVPGPAALELPPGPVALWTLRPGTPLALWEQVVLARAARGAAALFCPAYTAPLAHWGPLVVANHGIYEAVPEEFPRLARLRSTTVQRASARRAHRVIANSSVARGDVERFFGVPRDRIEVILPGIHERFFRRRPAEEVAAEVRRILGREVPYVLFVGKLARRRNLPALVAAFAAVRRRTGIPHRLVVVGPNTTGLDVAGLARAEGVADRVVYLPHMDAEPLARLYAGAEVFALPTTYEGLSWTILEAMASGTPVLTVPHPQLAEGGGDAAFVAASPAVEDLAPALERLLADPGLRARHAEAGRRRAAAFRWPAAAARTMEAIDRVAAPQDEARFRASLAGSGAGAAGEARRGAR
jgi:glycosyltransferase involved in cell wall biosynthesis